MSRIYEVIAPLTSLTAANTDIDWAQFDPADDKPLMLWGWKLSQIDQAGDAEEIDIRFRVLRMTATVTAGSGGTNLTSTMPNETELVTAGFTLTTRAFNPTVATTSGSTRVLEDFGWNFRQTPYEFWYPDARFCPLVKQTESLILRQETTLPNTVQCCATFWVEEFG